jgi:hypothetical protein
VNPFVATWLAVDVLVLFVLWRLVKAEARSAVAAVGTLQVIAALIAILSTIVDDDGFTAAAFWIAFVLIEAALTIVALTIGSRGLAMLGVVVGIAALSLFVAHSFASVAVAGAATVLSFGAALVPRARRASSVRRAN